MGLVPTAYIDLEVFGGTLATDCLTVSYSFLSGPYLSPTGAPCPLGPGNIVANGGTLRPELPAPTPLFVDPLPAEHLEISVAPGRFNPAVLTPFLDRTGNDAGRVHQLPSAGRFAGHQYRDSRTGERRDAARLMTSTAIARPQ